MSLDLPENVWAHILTFTDTETFLTLGSCSNLLYELSKRAALIKQRCLNLRLPHGVYRNLGTEAIETWFNGRLDGPSFTVGGGLTKLRCWDRDQLHGWERWVYEDGRSWGIQWRRGARHGLEYMLDIEGRSLLLTQWREDQRHGVDCSWNAADHDLESYCEWSHGLKHGLEQNLENGIVLVQNRWVEGLLDGDCFVSFPDGQLRDIAFYDDQGLLQGPRYVFFNNGIDNDLVLERRITYLDGEKHGLDQQFFDPLRLRSSRRYNRGKLEGISRHWDELGAVRQEGWWSAGQAVGLHRTWNKEGGLWEMMPFQDGKLHGTAQRLYRTGGIAWLCHWENGQKQGLEMRYYPDGARWHSTNWERNLKQGQELEWCNDIVVARCDWLEGKLHGKSEHFFESGQIRSKGDWKHGWQKGKHKEWYASGAKRSLKTWFKGQQWGWSKQWYESGQLEKKTLWEADAKWGIQKHFYANGQLAAQTRFVLGRRDGYEVSWHADGRLSLMLPFVDGLMHGIGWCGDIVEQLMYFWNDTTVCRADFLKLIKGEFVSHPHTEDILIPATLPIERPGVEPAVPLLQLLDSIPNVQPVIVDRSKLAVFDIEL